MVLEVEDASRWDDVAGQLVVDGLTGRDLPLGSLTVDLARHDGRIWFENLELARGDTTLVAGGSILPIEGGAEVAVEALRVRVADLTWALEEPTVVRAARRRVATEGLVVRSRTGSVAVEGDVDLEGALDLDVRLEEADIGLLAWAGLVPEVAGTVDATARLSGRADRPSGSLTLSALSPRYADYGVDSLEVQLRIEDNAIDLTRLIASSPRGRAELAGTAVLPSSTWVRELVDDAESWRWLWEGARLNGTLDARGLDLDAWIPPPGPDQSYGTVSGQLEVTGRTRAPQVRGRVAVDGYQNEAVSLPRVEATVSTNSEGLELTDGQILAPNPWVRFEGRVPLALSAIGRPAWDEAAGIELAIRSDGEVDLRPAATVFPFFTRLEGKLELDAAAVGPWRNPELSGTARIRDGLVQADQMLEQFREAEVDAVFEGNRLRVDRVQAREGEKGRLTANGAVVFDGLIPDDVWFDIDVDRVRLESVPFLRAIGTSDNLALRLERPLPNLSRAPKITGDVLVDLALYTGEFEAGGVGGPSASTVLGATAAPPWLAEIRITAVEEVRISNSVVELRVQGDVDFVRDQTGLRLRGVVEIPQGQVRVGYLDFDIVRGQLDFSRGSNLEPIVDITAETEVPVRGGGGIGRELERVTVQMTGTFAEPFFEFQSESGYDEKTIVNLLAGVPPEGQQGAALGDVSVHIAGNLLEDALAEQLGLIDTVDISTQEAGIEELGSTRIGVGKYLGQNLYLRYRQGLSIRERDLFLEYQVSRRLLFTSELRRRLRENATQTEFNLDLKFRVEY
ncbi:MAG: hypothetical protein HKO53_19075 [Gemmatimonadetes bacterium]|nr:hypothetical protein [Gemmatimonadota bacterium]